MDGPPVTLPTVCFSQFLIQSSHVGEDKLMKIGLLGAGVVAQAFARHATKAGHEVLFSNSRGPESLKQIVADYGPLASAGTMNEAADQPVVLLALPWKHVKAVLQHMEDWNNQILIDPTNAIDEHGLVDLHGEHSSEIVAGLASGARVVKAMNANFMENFQKDPIVEPFRRVIFISGDDANAINTIADLFEGFGLAPLLLGDLKQGGRMQAVGNTLAGHDFFLPWPARSSFPEFNGEGP